MNEDLQGKELWTQSEVAEYFRVVSATIKNWREQGLLSYWRAPGSSKVLFYRDEVLAFRQEHTTARREKTKAQAGNQGVRPHASPVPKDWRI